MSRPVSYKGGDATLSEPVSAWVTDGRLAGAKVFSASCRWVLLSWRSATSALYHTEWPSCRAPEAAETTATFAGDSRGWSVSAGGV